MGVNEMISASINHPSVILYGFYNEGPSNDHKACPGYNASAIAIRKRIGSDLKMVTWADNKKSKSKCLHIVDVISFNDYPGWYHDSGNLNSIKKSWHKYASWAKKNFPSKPFTISETGAGGIYEWTNKTDVKWSQLYQSEVIRENVEYALSSNLVSGIPLWQFSDIKGNDEAQKECPQCNYMPGPTNSSQPHNCSWINAKCKRPGGENHKGSVDFWRRRKMAFFTVQKLYHSETD